MTHSFQTSVHKSFRSLSQNFYQIEIQDFNEEYITFEVQASSFSDANAKGSQLAAQEGVDIYNMNIYKI